MHRRSLHTSKRDKLIKLKMRDKEKVCDECQKEILDKFAKCLLCVAIAHINCAIKNNRFSKEKIFYCKNHVSVMPRNPRRRIPESQDNEARTKICVYCEEDIEKEEKATRCNNCDKDFHDNCIIKEQHIVDEVNWNLYLCAICQY